MSQNVGSKEDLIRKNVSGRHMEIKSAKLRHFAYFSPRFIKVGFGHPTHFLCGDINATLATLALPETGDMA